MAEAVVGGFESRRRGRVRLAPIRSAEERNRILDEILFGPRGDWVASFVRRRYGDRYRHELPDLIQAGYLGAIHAADIWRASEGRFFIYAQNYVRFYVRQCIDGLTMPLRVPRSTRYARPDLLVPQRVTFDEAIKARTPEEDSPEAAVRKRQTAAEVARVLGAMDPLERSLLCWLYGVGRPIRTLRESAALLGLSEGRAKKIRDKALSDLEAEFRRAPL